MNQFLLLVVLFLLLIIVIQKRSKKEKQYDYSTAYKARYLLTQNEWHEYKKLKIYTDKKNLLICPKVRLLDLVEPKSGQGYMNKLNKVQSKHVDFVLADQDMRVKAILELDDSSHDRKDRIERDQFVDQVLTGAGYKIIHTRSITKDTLKGIH